MSFTIEWSPAASNDLEIILDYIYLESPTHAGDLLVKIGKAVSRLSDFPQSGRMVPELKRLNITSYREIIKDHWRIIYRIFDTKVRILSVLDNRRDIDDILMQRTLGI
jgi:plasmid stabilization system protein ParE